MRYTERVKRELLISWLFIAVFFALGFATVYACMKIEQNQLIILEGSK